MAKRPINGSAAQDDVFDALGMSAEDLGAGDMLDTSNDTGGTEDEELDTDGGEQDFDDDDTGDDDASQDDTGDDELDDLSLGGDDIGDSQQQSNLEVDRRGNVRVKGTSVDARGNIVDRNGRVLARAGNERRLWGDMNKARYDLARANVAYQRSQANLRRAAEIGMELQRRLEQVRTEAGQADGAKFGLDQSESLQALQWFKDFKADAVGSLKKLLTQAAARGIDVTKLGLQPGAVDPKSLMDSLTTAIDERLRPLTEQQAQEKQRREEEQRRQERQQQVERETLAFFEQNPAAKRYGAVFQQVYQDPRNARMTLGEVWARIQLQLAKQPRGRQTAQNRRGISNGRRAPAPSARNVVSSVHESSDDVLRQILDEQGVTH